jgi:hypothetical protein
MLHKLKLFISLALLLLIGCIHQENIPFFTNQTSSDTTADLIKIITEQEGFYQIDLNKQDLGLIAFKNLPDDSIRIVRNGKQQTFWIIHDGKQRNLVFYAPSNPNKYTKEQVTILGSVESTKRIVSIMNTKTIGDVEASPILEAVSQKQTRLLLLEQDLIYQPQVFQDDQWLWDKVTPFEGFDYTFDLPRLSQGNVKLKVGIWGMTQSEVNPDHHINLQVNEWLSEGYSWEGEGFYQVEVEIPLDILKEKGNQINITSPGDNGSSIEINWVDYLLIEYPFTLEPINHQVIFIQGNEAVDLNVFEQEVDVYDMSDPKRPIRIAEDLVSQKDWSGEIGRKYWLIDKQGYLSPVRVEPYVDQPFLINKEMMADYLIIAPDEWEDELQPLINHRISQGLKALFIPVNGIYDQFNWGYKEPEGIRKFLKYALENWENPPRYVFLVGDFSLDPRGNVNESSNNFIPSFFIHTQFGGETVSDTGFVELDGDSWPGDQRSENKLVPVIAVGRTPVSSQSELRRVIEKMMAYDQAVLSTIEPPKILMVADGQDLGFQEDAKIISKNFSLQTESFFPTPGIEKTSVMLSEMWRENFGYIIYFGHGSLQQWGKDRILSSQEVESLSPLVKPPIVIQFTCLSGFFAHPKQKSLSEYLLLHGDGGAISLLAPTSLTLPQDHVHLGNILAKEIQEGSHAKIGDLILATWQQYLSDPGSSEEVYRTFLLLGDPAQPLP